MKRANRKILWDHGGVSEVIGTILTLSITVVLFSGVILMVDQFPAPGDNVYTDFTATVEPIDNWNDGAYIHITNTGGQQLTGMWAIIALSIDDNTFTLKTKGALDGDDYGLGPTVPGHKGSDNGDDNWDTGERWTLFRDETAIGPESNIGVVIIELEKNALVWSASIQGASNEFGPIITNIRADSEIRTIRSDPVEFGRPFFIFADIYDSDGDLDQSTIYADLSSIDGALTSVAMTDPDGDGTFISEEMMGPSMGAVPIGYHIAVVHAYDLAGMHSTGVDRIAVGQDIGGQPNLVINHEDISINPDNPINGQTISIAVTVKNFGGNCTGVVNFYDELGSEKKIIGNESFTISGYPDQVTKTISWPASPGGNHTIWAEAVPLDAIDAEPGNNENCTNLTVMPTILIVDDDNHVSDMTNMDTVSFMRASLDSSNFDYDVYTVSADGDGPNYQYGDTKLKDYDVIIWMTGYEKSNTLTSTDQDNIMAFLNDDLNNGRTGSMWLIGQYLYDDADIPGTFFEDYLKVNSPPALSPSGPTNPLRGVAGNPVSDEWASVFIPIIERVQGEESSFRIEPNIAEGAEITFKEAGNTTAGDSVNYENIALDSRVLFCPWEFSRMSMTADQTQVAYKAIYWLGNITMMNGQDLAISQQTVEPSFVFFNQIVRVDAVIRNNGPEDLITDAALILDDDESSLIAYEPSIFVPKMGGSTNVSGFWPANELGEHILKWRVDPNGFITETNEGNNEVQSYITSGKVFVEFRILIVDDDDSPNNNGTMQNDTAYLTESMARLNYTYESENGVNTTYVVMDGLDGPINILEDYSAVFWITGGSTAGLTEQDCLALDDYLEEGGRLWLIGDDLWSGSGDPGLNLSRAMGINTTFPNAGISENLRGVDDSRISHGMNISILSNPAADVFIREPEAEGVFYRDYAGGTFCAVAYDEGNYHGFTLGFLLSDLYGTDPDYLSGNESVDELTYMFLHWLDKPDTRDEARITERDYYISDLHPQIGGAYILRARVHNVGANDVNLLVRFMDGTTQVGADSISITPDNCTSAEIIWRPLFAGQRTISILIDPINEEPEIFEWFNNNITFGIYVYFFWDDMENGGAKWSHGSTVMNINGENPLEYSSPEISLSTDIITEWNWAETYGIENTTTAAHSYPNSFYMDEGTGLFGQADVLLAIVIDNSPSMTDRSNAAGDTYLDVAKEAAITLVDILSDDSAVGIYDFKGANENEVLAITSLQGAGRDAVIDAIRNGISSLGNTNTVIWDTVGMGYMAVNNAQVFYPDLLPAVIALSDGADYQAADSSAYKEQSLEAGSDEWAPWGNMSAPAYPVVNYPSHWGKYHFYLDPLPGTWNHVNGPGDPPGAYKADRKGLLYSDIKIFTIGLALEHYDPPYGSGIPPFPVEYTQDTNTHIFDMESGTVEYNLWRIANTSGAEYFYAPTADELSEIFTELGLFLASGFNQTRASEPAPETRAVHDNSDKRAVSQSFSLLDVDTAKLTFWHKYNILQGGNGAFLQVGYKTSVTGDWMYKYIIPPGQYTGGLYFDEDRYDDFGNLIKWCWNGLSGSGSFGWDHVAVDISPYVPDGFNTTDGHVYRSEVVVNFNYTQFGGGTGVGWYIDDAKLVVSRVDGANISSTTKDIWKMVDNSTLSHSGNYSWCNIDPDTDEMKPGIDNYLVTTPIDLTSARNAYLSAYFKFNTNYNGGAPPDGFRVEVSPDGGITWTAINLGVRSAWGISGTGTDMEDGESDGKAYTGLPESGDEVADGYWVNASSLSRLNLDLSAWSGNQISIRFRVVTNNLPIAAYPHDNNDNFPDPGFGGFFVDDVQVYGETIFG